MAASFGLMAVAWGNVSPTMMFVLFGTLNFWLNSGPNLGTYVLPAICFFPDMRSTCHGISAFAGKFGAIVGACVFPLVHRSPLRVAVVLWIQTGVCLLGAFVSYFFSQDDLDYTHLNKEETHLYIQSIADVVVCKESSPRLPEVSTASTSATSEFSIMESMLSA